MLYDFISMWNLETRINKQTNRNKLIDTENISMDARWEGVAGMGIKGEGIKKYKWVIME